jgi:hypothetical protein
VIELENQSITPTEYAYVDWKKSSTGYYFINSSELTIFEKNSITGVFSVKNIKVLETNISIDLLNQ